MYIKNSFPRFVVAAAVLTASFPIYAADSTAPTLAPLKWEDCVRLAAVRNPDLLSAEQAMKANQALYRGSFNSILPSVTFTNTYTRSRRSSSGAVPNNTAFVGTSGSTTTELWQAQINAGLDLLNVANWIGIRAAAANYEASRENVRVSSAEALLALYKSFAGLLYAQDQTQVAKQIESIWKSNADMIALRYDSGNESKGNSMKTQAQLLQARADVAQATRDVRVAQQNLSQTLGETTYRAFAVTGTWTSANLPSLPDFDALVDKNPRVLVQQASIEQAQAALQNARAALFPTLSANYNRGFQGPHEFPTGNPYWSFTGQLSYALFGGGPTATYFANVAASRSLEKARLDLISLRQQVRSDLEAAWSGLAQAHDQVQVQAAFLDASQQRRREADIRYQNGLMTFEEWELVVIDLVNYEKSYLRSEQNLLLAEAQWRFAKGEGLGDSL